MQEASKEWVTEARQVSNVLCTWRAYEIFTDCFKLGGAC